MKRAIVLLMLLPTPCLAANDFSEDVNCVALDTGEGNNAGKLYDFHADANNTINIGFAGVPYDVNEGYYKEGTKSRVIKTGAMTATLADASLGPASFPQKVGNTCEAISVCAWLMPFSATVAQHHVVNKKYSTTDTGWSLTLDGALDPNRFEFSIGYNAGANEETFTDTSTAIVNKQWYHVGCTYEASSKAWRIRVYDDNGESINESTGTGSQTMDANTNNDLCVFNAGHWVLNTPFYGWYDEIVIFNDILTTNEIDQIRKGIYPSAGAQTMPLLLVKDYPIGRELVSYINFPVN